jgi:hypothetical protein
MSHLIDLLDEQENWEDDLEIEELPVVRSATLPIVITPPWVLNGGTTLRCAPVWACG